MVVVVTVAVVVCVCLHLRECGVYARGGHEMPFSLEVQFLIEPAAKLSAYKQDPVILLSLLATVLGLQATTPEFLCSFRLQTQVSGW